jgi:curved DNA-binding protein
LKFRDYYDILGVPRDATAEQIRKAFRTLARRHHPDANKGDAGSSEKFKEISEAYEVLKDEKKRRMYDQLGPNYKQGQDFNVPPDFGGRGRPPYARASGAGAGVGGFSDFFESLFGSMGGAQRGGFQGNPFGGAYDFQGGGGAPPQQDSESTLEVPIETVLAGGVMRISLESGDGRRNSLEVKIPKGIGEGRRIRLSGQGAGGGDLYLRIKIKPGKFKVEGLDVIGDLPLSVHEAALGATVSVTTPDAESITLTIPPASSSGRRLRLRGRGLSGSGDAKGDFYYQIAIVLPKTLSDEERKLFESMRENHPFNPRETR